MQSIMQFIHFLYHQDPEGYFTDHVVSQVPLECRSPLTLIVPVVEYDEKGSIKDDKAKCWIYATPIVETFMASKATDPITRLELIREEESRPKPNVFGLRKGVVNRFSDCPVQNVKQDAQGRIILKLKEWWSRWRERTFSYTSYYPQPYDRINIDNIKRIVAVETARIVRAALYSVLGHKQREDRKSRVLRESASKKLSK